MSEHKFGCHSPRQDARTIETAGDLRHRHAGPARPRREPRWHRPGGALEDSVRRVLRVAADACERFDQAQADREAALLYAAELRSLLDQQRMSSKRSSGRQ